VCPDVATDVGQQNMEFTPMTSWTTGAHVSRDLTYDDITSPMSSNDDVTAMKVFHHCLKTTHYTDLYIVHLFGFCRATLCISRPMPSCGFRIN